MAYALKVAGILILAVACLCAQTATIPFNGVPTGSCSFVLLAVDLTNHNLYYCPAGSWVLVTTGGGGSTAWSALTNPMGNLALSMGTNTSTFTTGIGTGSANIWTYQDTTGNTGTGSLFNINTIGTSAMIPFTLTAKGTSNGVQMSNAAVLAPLGTGAIDANQLQTPITANITTAGLGVDIVGYVSNVTGQASNQNVTLATAPTAGHYHLKYYADQSATCSGTPQVSFTFAWTDATNARTLGTGPLTLSGAQQASGWLSGDFDVWVGSGNVTYTSTISGTISTCTYDIHVAMERGQ